MSVTSFPSRVIKRPLKPYRPLNLMKYRVDSSTDGIAPTHNFGYKTTNSERILASLLTFLTAKLLPTKMANVPVLSIIVTVTMFLFILPIISL